MIVAMTGDHDRLAEEAAARADDRECVRHGVDAAEAIGAGRVVGPLHAAIGRTWRMDGDERAEAMDDVVDQPADGLAVLRDRFGE